MIVDHSVEGPNRHFTKKIFARWKEQAERISTLLQCVHSVHFMDLKRPIMLVSGDYFYVLECSF